MEALITSLTTGVTDMTTSALSAIGSVAPAALPILGAGIVIGIVIKTIRKFK